MEPTPANSLRAHSYGCGQLIAAALDAGATEIVLGVGGSAMSDGGSGALRALGLKPLDAAGNVVPLGGGSLADVAPGCQRPRSAAGRSEVPDRPDAASKYFELMAKSSGSSSTGCPSSPDKQKEELLKQIEALRSQGTKTTTTTTTGSQASAQKQILKALEALREADNQIDDEGGDGVDVSDAEEEAFDAHSDFYYAVEAYLGGNYDRALSFAEKATDAAIDAFEEAGGESEEDEVEEDLERLEDDIDAAWTEIEEADDNGEDVDQAEELLEEAEDRLEDAEVALADDDVEEVYRHCGRGRRID